MRAFLLLLSCLFATLLSAQFKNDNIAYRTVFINDLCDSLKKNPDRLILDVRSKGEFSDTSSQASLNIGHLRGAVNIDVNEVKNRLNEIRAYKDKPVFVICSHSQRSRVCSKMLSDSGFTHVINVNGAMTEFNLIKNTEVPCVGALYETANKFPLLSPGEVATLITKNKDLFILDTRSDSAFRGISRDASQNALGRLKNAVNIPLAQLQASLDRIPRNRPILVIADYGRDTNLGAKLLTDNGFSNVYAAFNGLNEWISASGRDLPQRDKLWEHNNRYNFISATEMGSMLIAQPAVIVLDVRTKEEFTNTVKDRPWLNRGHVEGAINIPNAERAARLSELNSYKQTNIIVYTFGTSPESCQAAKTLADNGFTRIYMLTGGLFTIRSKAANQKGLSKLMALVVDVPAENQ